MRASSTTVAMASSFVSAAVALHLKNSQQLLKLRVSATEVESILNFMVYRFIVMTLFNLIELAVAVRVSPKSFSAN